jgi:hypothetical protein
MIGLLEKAPKACKVPCPWRGGPDGQSRFASISLCLRGPRRQFCPVACGLRGSARGQAQSSDDRAILAEIFAGEEKLTQLPDGRYRCRTIKLGGLLPLVIYNYFDCAVHDNGTTIEKLTGSQRFIGSLTPSGDAMFYAGALHYGDEQPMAYGTDPDRDQVGCIVRISGEDEKYRLEMPAPRRESTHDVIELVRR